MVRRSLHLALAVFVSLWLGVVVPGHRHGGAAHVHAADHPGNGQADLHRHPEHAGHDHHHHGHHHHGDAGHAHDDDDESGEDEGAPAQPPQPHDESHCTICLFAAGLAPAPACTVALPAPELAEVTAQFEPAAPVLPDPVPAYFGRAPPAAA